jgi:putative transposase
MDVQHTKHVTYKLAYHFVWCPKYRKKILVGRLATFLEQEIRRICEANTWAIGALNVQQDHVHLFRSRPSECFSLTDRSCLERNDRPERLSTLS